MYKVTEQLLKRLCAWSKILDGVIGVITLGFVWSSFSLKVAKVLARHRWKGEL